MPYVDRTRANEKTYPDVGGGFVEPHERGDGIDWSEAYPHKGTETPIAHGELERGQVGGRQAPAGSSSGARPGAPRGQLGDRWGARKP